MSFTSVLIAGGRSERMGCDKAFVEFGGRPLWQFQLDKLAATETDQILISARRGQSFQTDRATVVYDDFPGTGPLGGIVTAFKQARNVRILVLGVDLPLMTTHFLRQKVLIQAFFESGVVYEDRDRFEPFAALYPKSLLVLAQELLRKGRFAMQDFIGEAVEQGAIEALPLPVSFRPLFTNVNTPDDLTAAEAKAGGQLDLPMGSEP